MRALFPFALTLLSSWSLKHEHDKEYVRVGLKSSTRVQCSSTQNWVEMTCGSKQVWNWNVSCSLYSPWASDKVHPEVLRPPPGLTVWGGGASYSHQASVCEGLRWKQCDGRASVVGPHWRRLEVGSDHWPPHCPHLAYCDEPQSEMPRSTRSQSEIIPLIKNSLSCPSMWKEMVIF